METEDTTSYGADGLILTLREGDAIYGVKHPPAIPYSIAAFYIPADDNDSVACVGGGTSCATTLEPGDSADVCIREVEDAGGAETCDTTATNITWSLHTSTDDTQTAITEYLIELLREIEQKSDDIQTNAYVSGNGLITIGGQAVLQAAGAGLANAVDTSFFVIEQRGVFPEYADGGAYAEDYTPDLGIEYGAYRGLADTFGSITGAPGVLFAVVMVIIFVGALGALAYFMGDDPKSAVVPLLMPIALMSVITGVVHIWYIFAAVSLIGTAAYARVQQRFVPA